MVIAAVVGLVVVAGGLALLLSPDETDEGAAPSTAPVEVSGTDLPPFSNGPDAAIGTDAPTVSGQGLDSAALTIGGGGEPAAVVFLAHWCPHCREEVPAVQEWLDDGGLPEGVHLYGVATGTDAARPNFPPTDWLADEGWTPSTLLDDDASRAGQAYGLTGYPYWVLLDGDGRVAGRHVGALPVDQLEQSLSALR
ncbi:MAG: TlpA disulfide reductase family protein [Egibacteraceae bacterium]